MFMVLVVKCRGNEPASHPGPIPPARQELVSAVHVQAHDDVRREAIIHFHRSLFAHSETGIELRR